MLLRSCYHVLAPLCTSISLCLMAYRMAQTARTYPSKCALSTLKGRRWVSGEPSVAIALPSPAVGFLQPDLVQAPVVGIRYNKTADAPANIGVSRTASGKFVDSGPPSQDVDDTQYWADRPSGVCGGQRARTTFAEDLAVSWTLFRLQSCACMSKRLHSCLFPACLTGKQS